MPPLRPSLFPRYRGYVCPSCTAKIQARSLPPWLARSATSQATKNSTKEKSSRKQLKKEQKPLDDESLTISHYDEGEDGSWLPEEDQEQDLEGNGDNGGDIKAILSRIEALESDLSDTKVGPTEDNPFPHLPFYNQIASGNFNLLDAFKGGKGVDDEILQNAAADFAKSKPSRKSKEERKSEIKKLHASLAMLEARPDVTAEDPELSTGKALLRMLQTQSKLSDDHVSIRDPEGLGEILEEEDDELPTTKSEGVDEEELRALLSHRPARTKDGRELDIQGLLATIPATSAPAYSTTIPVGAFPEDRQVNILRLNVALEKILKNDSDQKTPNELWKWYSLSRKGLALNWQQVSAEVWTILWAQFTKESEKNPDRMPHTKIIAEDMRAAGIKLGSAQILLYMEALFLDGNQKEAIREWEVSRAALIYEKSVASDYWALGARMLANNRRPDEAQQAADILLNDDKGKKDARVLLPIIRSWLSSTDKASVQKAWALYIRFKFFVGNDATMDDYDAITGAFLDVKQTDLALAVFRDMMMTGDPAAYHQDSVALYKRNRKSLGDLRSINFWPEETAWKSHGQFTMLLPKQKNKFFFGSWIKKLIGDGRVDSAAQVMELMFERGIPPDPRHMNGIIGAWFRTGTAANQRKAEEKAWKMIGDRMDFVQARTHKHKFSEPLRGILNRSKDDFKRLPSSQIAVLATSETFSILIEYYQKRQKHDRVQELYDMIGTAQISPSTGFLNDMLLIGVRSHGAQWSWATYQSMLNHGVKPNIVTFGLLWRLMKDHVDPIKNRTKYSFPSCRTLFAEMAGWEKDLQKDGIPRELYELIVLCFGLADDQIGTAVAIRAMQQVFDISPDPNAVRSVALQLAKVGLIEKAPKRHGRLNLNSETKKKLAQIAKIFGSLKEARIVALAELGVNVDDMDEAQKSEESILLLCDVLKFTAQRRNKAYIEASWENVDTGSQTGSVDKMGQAAAEEMGVPDCAPWHHV